MLTAPTFPVAQRDSSVEVEEYHDHSHLAPSLEDERGRHTMTHGNRDRSISPVLSRGPSGVEIVKLNSRARLAP
jgi:hypothetical protein